MPDATITFKCEYRNENSKFATFIEAVRMKLGLPISKRYVSKCHWRFYGGKWHSIKRKDLQ